MKTKLLLLPFSIFFTILPTHYDAKYWEWQRKVGQAGGKLNKFKFETHIKPSDTVIDVGCGGGYLLYNLDCARKIGIEVIEEARKNADNLGIETYSSVYDIEDNIADVIISNHAFEHISNVFEVLQELKKKLKPSGILVIVVPSEQANNSSYEYKENDRNQHIFTWTPMTLGNLVKLAGFTIIKAEALQHCWVGNYLKEASKADLTAYHAKCRNHAIKTHNYQVKVIAKK